VRKETTSIADDVPVIELRGVVKDFPGVRALKGVDLTVRKQEILGLVGENGAGKSTLMKILIGLHKMDGGSMKVRGVEVHPADPQDAIRNGVGMVFQEQSLLANMTVAENILLCHEKRFTRGPFLRSAAILHEAESILEECSIYVSPRALVSDISQAQRQMVEIARLLWLTRQYGVVHPVLILDEPTTVLVKSEIDQLFSLLRALRSEASIIFISHRLEEVLELATRIVIFKDGESISDIEAAQATVEQIENLMVGHELAADHFIEVEQREPEAEEVIRVEGLSVRGRFDPISFSVRKGEILCFGGVIGSGKEELCKCLAGVRTADGGQVMVDGKRADLSRPSAAIAAGIGYLPADRRDEGLGLQMDVKANITLVMLRKLLTGGILSLRREKVVATDWVNQLHIKARSLATNVSTLSGGNQQKVVMAKWLASSARLLILDHPTRGVDVGAKEEIYHRIRALARQGMAMIIMCDTMEEDIGLCNRMIALRDGKVTAEIPCAAGSKPAPVDIIRYVV
jgi:ribose transport system ATP-binding protein